MALLLHYTGQDYISRGLLNTALTPGSTSAIVGGCKTGKGFEFDGTVNSALIGNEIIEDTPNASFSFWYKHVLSSSANQTLFCTQGDVFTTNNTRLLARTLNNRILFGVRNTSQLYQHISSNTLLTIDTWYHLTFILEESESKVSLYINGQYNTRLKWTGVLATSNQPIVFGKRAINYNIEPLMGQICNFKYYNHALSQKEINDDYRSLILHYPLKNENEISPYIALNKVETFTSLSPGFTQTQISKYHLHIIGSWGGTTSSSWPLLRRAWNQYVDGNTYTITFTYRLNSYSNLSYVELRHARWENDFQSGKSAYRMNYFPLGEWFTVTLTKKLDSADPLSVKPLNPQVEIYVARIANNQPSSVDLEIKDIYVTEGDSILPYPITNTGTILDVSGFKRHITNLTANTVTLDSKSQVYSASLKNDGTQSLVGTSDLTDLNGLDEGSFSFRVFLTKNTLSDQYVIYNMTAEIGGNGISFVFRVGVAFAYFYGVRIQFNYTPTVDAWHHIVLVKTSTQIKVYADGVNIYTVSATTSSKNFSNITSISSSPSGTGSISDGNVQDIRFYAKALTQAEVTELYQTRHMVDKDSNYYTYELIEGKTTVGMNKQGQLLCDEIIENEDGTFKIVSNKTIKTKEIKEI